MKWMVRVRGAGGASLTAGCAVPRWQPDGRCRPASCMIGAARFRRRSLVRRRGRRRSLRHDVTNLDAHAVADADTAYNGTPAAPVVGRRSGLDRAQPPDPRPLVQRGGRPSHSPKPIRGSGAAAGYAFSDVMSRSVGPGRVSFRNRQAGGSMEEGLVPLPVPRLPAAVGVAVELSLATHARERHGAAQGQGAQCRA
jgi:hypothetical protein